VRLSISEFSPDTEELIKDFHSYIRFYILCEGRLVARAVYLMPTTSI